MLKECDYCDYDTCVALEELGYPQYCYDNGGELDRILRMVTLYNAQKWLREEKKLHITIFSWSQESWQYRITKPHQKLEDGLYGEDFSSYEEALSEGIKNTINFLKENNGLV
jgi:hypothetical protein